MASSPSTWGKPPAEGEAEPGDDERVFILVRDQLKMMRNAVRDLDPERYARDLEARGHAMTLLHEKWASVVYPSRHGPVRVSFDAPRHGDVAECCMEFSALDRVLYNLVNNAAEHGLGDRVHVSIVPVNEGRELQFRVVNRLGPEHAATLVERFGGDDVSQLLHGGFTTGGHGVGTRICAEMVRHGYGLDGVEEVIRGGYAGAHVVGDRFVAFFHWPALASA